MIRFEKIKACFGSLDSEQTNVYSIPLDMDVSGVSPEYYDYNLKAVKISKYVAHLNPPQGKGIDLVDRQDITMLFDYVFRRIVSCLKTHLRDVVTQTGKQSIKVQFNP